MSTSDGRGERTVRGRVRAEGATSDGTVLAVEAALGGELGALRDLFERHSHLPDRPNHALALRIGELCAAAGGRADPTLRTLSTSREPFGRIVASYGLALLLAGKKGRAPSAGRAAELVKALEELAGDERRLVREAVVLALRESLARAGDEGASVLAALAPFEDGFLHAAVLLEALTDRDTLARLSDGPLVVGVVRRAFLLADRSSRSEERLQGVRELRLRLPGALAAVFQRYREGEALAHEVLAATRPETREGAAELLRLLRKSDVPAPTQDALAERFRASEKTPRDAARIVPGTRNRGGRARGR